MKEIVIDCAVLRSRRVLHDYLEQEMELPSYYGRNLDALRDVLTDVNGGSPVRFRIVNRDRQSSRMVSLYETMIAMIRDVGEENPNVSVVEDVSLPENNA